MNTYIQPIKELIILEMIKSITIKPETEWQEDKLIKERIETFFDFAEFDVDL